MLYQSFPSTPPSVPFMNPEEKSSLIQPEPSTLVSARVVYIARQRLSRLNAALNYLVYISRIPPPLGLQNIKLHKTYLTRVLREQEHVQFNARQLVIAASRAEATSSNGIPTWQGYLQRVTMYRHLGIELAEAHTDSWRDGVLEQLEQLYEREPRYVPSDWEVPGPDPAESLNLSPATAGHLLLFEESNAAACYNREPQLSPTSNPSSDKSLLLDIDTDPGTPPSIVEAGNETESDSAFSAGPRSPTDGFSLPNMASTHREHSPFVARPSQRIQLFQRGFLAPADAPKSKPFTSEEVYNLYEIFDQTGIEYYIFERRRDAMQGMEVKSCQKVDLLRPFVELARRFKRPTTHTQIPLEILLRMSRVIVNSFAWPQAGETWREFLADRMVRYRMEKEELDATTPPELRRAEHADFCYAFMVTVAEYIGTNPSLLDSEIDRTRLRENEKWDYVLAYRCIWENLGLIKYVNLQNISFSSGITTSQLRARARPRLQMATKNQ